MLITNKECTFLSSQHEKNFIIFTSNKTVKDLYVYVQQKAHQALLLHPSFLYHRVYSISSREWDKCLRELNKYIRLPHLRSDQVHATLLTYGAGKARRTGRTRSEQERRVTHYFKLISQPKTLRPSTACSNHDTFRNTRAPSLDRVDIRRKKTRGNFPRRPRSKREAFAGFYRNLIRRLRNARTSRRSKEREIYRPPLIIGMRNELHTVGGLTKCRDDGIVTVASFHAGETRLPETHAASAGIMRRY